MLSLSVLGLTNVLSPCSFPRPSWQDCTANPEYQLDNIQPTWCFRLTTALCYLGEGHTRQKDVEVSPTQSRISPSIQRVLRQMVPSYSINGAIPLQELCNRYRTRCCGLYPKPEHPDPQTGSRYPDFEFTARRSPCWWPRTRLRCRLLWDPTGVPHS